MSWFTNCAATLRELLTKSRLVIALLGRENKSNEVLEVAASS